MNAIRSSSQTDSELAARYGVSEPAINMARRGFTFGRRAQFDSAASAFGPRRARAVNGSSANGSSANGSSAADPKGPLLERIASGRFGP